MGLLGCDSGSYQWGDAGDQGHQREQPHWRGGVPSQTYLTVYYGIQQSNRHRPK